MQLCLKPNRVNIKCLDGWNHCHSPKFQVVQNHEWVSNYLSNFQIKMIFELFWSIPKLSYLLPNFLGDFSVFSLQNSEMKIKFSKK